MKNNKQKLETIQLGIVGSGLTMEGYDILSSHAILGSLILSFGIILILYLVYDLIKIKESKTLKLLVHLFEALALFFTAYIFYLEDKHYLQYITLLASIGSLIAFIIMFFKTINSPDKGQQK